jgi:hypothetical protein
MWTMTKALSAKVDAFDLWCQRRILRINFIQRVTNSEVRRRTGCFQLLPNILRSRRLQLFGHIARADSQSDHRRALYSAIHGPPTDWKRPRGRPQYTWTRTIEADLQPANIGLYSAWHRAQDREAWRKLVRTATLQPGIAPDDDDNE